MSLVIPRDDAAFLTRLFGNRIPADEPTFRPALEWAVHVDMAKETLPNARFWARCGKPMLSNLVSYVDHNGLQKQPLGWDLTETDDLIVLGVLTMKAKARAA
jgi:hypothetical protein